MGKYADAQTLLVCCSLSWGWTILIVSLIMVPFDNSLFLFDFILYNFILLIEYFVFDKDLII